MYFEGNCVDLQPTGYRNEMVKKISLGKYFTQLLLKELFTLFHYIYVCVWKALKSSLEEFLAIKSELFCFFPKQN